MNLGYMERAEMRKGYIYLFIALLTFTIGLVGTRSYRDYKAQRDELLWIELRLRDKLFHFRRALDIYTADKGELPQSLDDLMTSGYVDEVPFDPITSRRAWKIVVGADPNSLKGDQGIIDVHSTSSAISSRGTPYSEW
jgi:general secretion pathway protein G